MSKAFVILKPDCVARGLVGGVISRFERKGFKIKRMKFVQKTQEWAEENYSHLVNDILVENVRFMVSGKIIGIVLCPIAGSSSDYDNIVETVKSMIGPMDSSKAPPGTIRGDFGKLPIRYNIIHCADPDKVDIEIKNFFNTETDL